MQKGTEGGIQESRRTDRWNTKARVTVAVDIIETYLSSTLSYSTG